MGTVPDREPTASSPWDAITCIQRIRELLEDYFTPWGVDYSIELDLEYQSLRSKLLSLMEHPCFTQMWSPTNVLAPSLGDWAIYDAYLWSDSAGGRSAVITLQSDLLKALIDADISRPAMRESEPAEPLFEHDTGHDGNAPVARTPGLGHLNQRGKNAASRRKESGQRKARALVGAGLKREAIARQLGVSIRTVYNYLSGSEAE